MFNHLNVNSQRVVHSLCKGEVARLGNRSINIPDESIRELLALLSINLTSLQALSGQALIDKVGTLYHNFDFGEIKKQIDHLEYGNEEQAQGFKLA